MRRYNTTATYSGRRSYSPGILQYSSPASSGGNSFKARSEAAQRTRIIAQNQSQNDRQGS